MVMNDVLYNVSLTSQITKHLFAEEPPDGLGTDLISLNIQRAREHGLPGKKKSTNFHSRVHVHV